MIQKRQNLSPRKSKQSCPEKKNYLIVDGKDQCSRLTSHIVTIISQNLDVISNLKHFRNETVCVIKNLQFYTLP